VQTAELFFSRNVGVFSHKSTQSKINLSTEKPRFGKSDRRPMIAERVSLAVRNGKRGKELQ